MGGLPDALLVIDVGYEKNAITEAQKLSLPIVGIVDTNTSPDGIDYIIPGNDDAAKAIHLYVKAAADTILAAKQRNVETQGAEEFVEVSDESAKKSKDK